MDIIELTTLDNIRAAFYACAKVSFWKESTQKFGQNLLKNCLKLQKDLREGTYQISSTINFTIYERGKCRNISAPRIKDRIVQKLLMQYVLLPKLTRPLIYDNYASLKGKGTSLARKRIMAILERFIRKYGTEGYILQVDIKKYFENIDHEVLKKLYRKEVNESPEIMKLLDYIIDTSSDSDKGLNLGSECPQIFAVYYLHPLDTWIKIVRGEHYYGRYMDDFYILSPSKEHLIELLKDIRAQLEKMKLEVNEKKTHITKLTHGFTFLQTRYLFAGNKIIRKLTHAKIARERKRLKAFRRLVDKEKMTEFKAYSCYKSWRETIIQDYNCWETIGSMDKLFKELFPTYSMTLRPYYIKEIFKGDS